MKKTRDGPSLQILHDKKCFDRSNYLKRNLGCYEYYSACDWMTVKIREDTKIMFHLYSLVNNSHSYDFEGLPFRLTFFSILNGGQLKVFQMWDVNKDNGSVNLIGSVVIKLDCLAEDGLTQKRNTNVPTRLELNGHFWNMYSFLFDDLCEVFKIDKDDVEILLRFDYCKDICGIDFDDVYKKYRIDIPEGKTKPGNIYVDGKIFLGYTDKFDRGVLGLYNKRKQLLDTGKYKHRDINGEQPWVKYIREEASITRFEYRANAKGLREPGDRSINYMFTFGEQLLCEHVKKYYELDLMVFTDNQYQEKPKRKEKIVNVSVKNKILHSEQMVRTYGQKIIDLAGEDEFYDFLYYTFGDEMIDKLLENRKYIKEIIPSDFNIIKKPVKIHYSHRNIEK